MSSGGMRQGLGQTTVLRQDLRINPRLYQAMDLLYMPLLDLQAHLKQELLENPFLELLEPSEEESPLDEVAGRKDAERERAERSESTGEMNWENVLLNGFEPSGGYREESEE